MNRVSRRRAVAFGRRARPPSGGGTTPRGPAAALADARARGALGLGRPDPRPARARRARASSRASRGSRDAGVEHVSVYLLETEKSKTIEEDRRLHPERYLSDDAQADLWLEMGEALAGRGFAHYEISNWARPGREARHNVKYWLRTPTLGLGVSAHELWAGRRRANVSNLEQYLAALEAGRRPVALDEPVGAAEAAGRRSFSGCGSRAGVAAGAGRGASSSASQDVRLWNDYEGWLAEGILERSRRPRAVHRARATSSPTRS